MAVDEFGGEPDRLEPAIDAQAMEIGRYRRSDISPGLRLKAIGEVFRHPDVRTILDTSFLLDSRILSLDCRSLMVCLLPAARPLGSIWFSSSLM